MQLVEMSPLKAGMQHAPTQTLSNIPAMPIRMNRNSAAQSPKFGGLGFRALRESLAANVEGLIFKYVFFMSDEAILDHRIRKHEERKTLANSAVDLQNKEKIKAENQLANLQRQRDEKFQLAAQKRQSAQTAPELAAKGLNNEAVRLLGEVQSLDTQIVAQTAHTNRARLAAQTAKLRHGGIVTKLEQYQTSLKQMKTRTQMVKKDEQLADITEAADRMAGNAQAGGDPLLAALQDQLEDREAGVQARTERLSGSPDDLAAQLAGAEFETTQNRDNALANLDAMIAAGGKATNAAKDGTAGAADEVQK